MPALNQAREQTKAAICMVQLKQWGIIWNMYTDENAGRFSTGMSLKINYNWARGEWINALEEEWQKHPELLLCPSAVKPNPELDASGNPAVWGGPKCTYRMPYETEDAEFGRGEHCSYGANNWIYDPPAGVPNIQGRVSEWHWRKVDQKGAENIPVFLDSMWRGGGPFYEDTDVRCAPPEFNGEWTGAGYEIKHFSIARHSGGIKVLFMDFSVRTIDNLKDLWGFKWHKTFDTTWCDQPWWDWGPWLEIAYN